MVIRNVTKRRIEMKKVTHLIAVIGASLVVLTTPAIAGESEVTWTNPEKYRDIDEGNRVKSKFKEQVFREFGKHFNKLAAKLPEGQKLMVEVTDLDLAGDVRVGGINEVRIVKSIYFPRMEFNYQVLDSTGSEVQKGSVNLKDMNFMNGTNLRYGNKSFAYERRMLDEWFNKTFTTTLAKN